MDSIRFQVGSPHCTQCVWIEFKVESVKGPSGCSEGQSSRYIRGTSDDKRVLGGSSPRWCIRSQLSSVRK